MRCCARAVFRPIPAGKANMCCARAEQWDTEPPSGEHDLLLYFVQIIKTTDLSAPKDLDHESSNGDLIYLVSPMCGQLSARLTRTAPSVSKGRKSAPSDTKSPIFLFSFYCTSFTSAHR